jgi:ACS family sodium-dependent inorganic phosphate cotransporter-like MFS transporter 6/7/8
MWPLLFAGSYAGAVLGIPLSGILTEYFNWQIAFYFYGIIGMIWSVYWWHFSYERPAIHPKISEAERIYIEESIGEACSISNKVKHFNELISCEMNRVF